MLSDTHYPDIIKLFGTSRFTQLFSKKNIKIHTPFKKGRLHTPFMIHKILRKYKLREVY